MRKFNVRFAAGLALACVLTAAAAVGLYVLQRGRIARDILWQARTAHDEGASEKAVLFGHQYLAFAPDDIAFLHELADWLGEKPTTIRQQHAVAERILRVDPNDEPARRLAADLAMKCRLYSNAEDHLTALLKTRPNDADLIAKLADCENGVGKHTDAERGYKKSLAIDPKRVSTAVAYAALLQNHLKRPDEAKALLDAAVAGNPDSAEALAGRARLARQQGRVADAVADLKVALAKKPNDPTLLMFASEIEQAAGQGSARERLEQAHAAKPDDPKIVYNLCWHLIVEGKTDQAMTKLKETLAKTPNNADLLVLMGDVLAQDGRIEPLEGVLRDLQKLAGNAAAGPIRDRVDYIQARLAMRRGDWPKAAGLLDKLRLTTLKYAALNKQCDYLLAQCHEQLHDTEAELAAYGRIVKLDAAAAIYRLEHAKALCRAGRYSDAVGEYRQAAFRVDTNARLLADTTREVAEACLADEKAFKELEATVDVLKLDGKGVGPTLARLTLDRVRGKAAEGVMLAHNQLAAFKGSVALRVAYAGQLEAVYGVDRGVQSLSDAERLLGDQADFRIARIRLLASRPTPSTFDALQLVGQRLDGFGLDDRMRILTELTAACDAVGDAAGAVRSLERLRQMHPDHLPSRESLAHRTLRAGNAAGFDSLVKEIERIEGADGWAGKTLAAAALIYRNHDLSASHAAAEALVKRRPRDPVAAFLLGRAEELAGRNGAALDQYRKALSARLLDEPSADLLFAELPGASRAAPTRVLLDESPLVATLRLDRHRDATRTLLAQADPSQRTKLAARIAERDARGDVAQHVWLGLLFERSGLSDQSEAALIRATRVAPQSEDGWVALAGHHAARQANAKVQETLVQAQRSVGPERAAVVVGRCLDAIRQPAEAAKQYERVLAAEPGNVRVLRLLAAAQLAAGQMNAGRLTLARIAAPTTRATLEDARWARRTLALHLTATPSKAAFEQSLALLDANAKAGEPSDDDLRTRVAVLAAQKSRPFGNGRTARQEAIALLTPLADRPTAQPDDLLQLSRLTAAEGDAARGQALAARLMADYPDYYPAVAFRVRDSLRTGDLAAAGQAVTQLTTLGGDRLDTRVLQFQYQTLAGEPDKARRLLADYVGSADQPAVRVRRGLAVAGQIDEFLQSYPLADRPDAAAALRDMAVRYYRDGMESDPQALLRVVTLLCRNNKTPAALDALQEAGKRFSVEVRAAAMLAVLRNGKPSAQQFAATDAYVRDALQANPRSIPLLVSQADLNDLRGNHERAKELYREVLDRDPENPVARNNLAWILSYDKTRIDESLAHIQRAIDGHGPLDDLLDTRAKILFDSGRHEAGLKDLCEAINESPSAARYLYLAAMHRRGGRAEQAERALDKAKRFGVAPQDVHPLDIDARQMLLPQ